VTLGRVAVCRWCWTIITKDNENRWIHTSLAYFCKDPWGFTVSTTAEPFPERMLAEPSHGSHT
jgi:hypothetical protein